MNLYIIEGTITEYSFNNYCFIIVDECIVKNNMFSTTTNNNGYKSLLTMVQTLVLESTTMIMY